MRLSQSVTRAFLPVLSLAIVFLAYSREASAEDKAYLNAPVLPAHEPLVISLSSTGKEVEWQIAPASTTSHFDKDDLVLTRTDFKLGYKQYNPFRVRIAVSVSNFADPRQKALSDFASAAGGFLGILTGVKVPTGMDKAALIQECQGTPSGEANVQDQLASANANLEKGREDVLKAPASITNAWNDHKEGPDVMQAGLTDLKAALVCVQAAGEYLKVADSAGTKANGTESEQQQARNQAKELAKVVSALKTTLDALVSALQEDKEPRHWSSDKQYFLFSDGIDPTTSTGKEVTITITPLELKATQTGIELKTGDPVTAVLKARHYSVLLPEAGVGLVFGFIDRPKYGTTVDSSGKTVIKLSSTDHVAVDPTVMLNLVCRCKTTSTSPMFQLGVAASKDLPSILLGGGIRLHGAGKGDFAVGGGLLLGWYKDLKTLQVGGAVSGTSDIDADLTFRHTPKPAPYLNVQYKF